MSGLELRLAFRREGKWWNAYVARIDTMSDALRIGGMLMALAEASPAAKDAFMDCMKKLFQEHMKLKIGVAPTEWNTRPAPEHERSGNA